MTPFDSELLIIVTARAGSKRLEHKNVRQLGGKPLLEWTQRAIVESELTAPCVLSTDSEEIAKIGRALGWEVPFLRPAKLATDNATTVEAVIHTLHWWESNRGNIFKYLMLLQPTSPFRGGRVLREAVDLLGAAHETNAVVGVTEVKPIPKFQVTDEGYIDIAWKPPDQKSNFVPNGAIYLIRRDIFLEQETFFPTKSKAIIMDSLSSVDIDTPFDWLIAEMIAARYTEYMKQSNV